MRVSSLVRILRSSWNTSKWFASKSWYKDSSYSEQSAYSFGFEDEVGLDDGQRVGHLDEFRFHLNY